MKLVVVTATTDPARARACIESWDANAHGHLQIEIVVNGRSWTPEDGESTGVQAHWILVNDYVGTVRAFHIGVTRVLEDDPGADIIACLHDDFRIDEARWDEKVIRHVERHPACGLLGFGGALGLGHPNLYTSPYDPMQLARRHFRSNLVDAEVHGIRSLLPERVACLDGFSQVGRREFWMGDHLRTREGRLQIHPLPERKDRPWDVLADLGIVHHWYDGGLGCLAKRYGWETWYLPLRGQHYGGQTAVGDRGYAEWAKTQTPDGDQGFWKHAHEIGYRAFKDILPLRVG